MCSVVGWLGNISTCVLSFTPSTHVPFIMYSRLVVYTCMASCMHWLACSIGIAAAGTHAEFVQTVCPSKAGRVLMDLCKRNLSCTHADHFLHVILLLFRHF